MRLCPGENEVLCVALGTSEMVIEVRGVSLELYGQPAVSRSNGS